MTASTDTSGTSNPRMARLRRLSRLLDSSIPLPGGFRMGLDGVIGLIPGIGDMIGGLLSTYILAEGARAGASKSTLIRMAWNVLVEVVIGAIPFFGDIFDIAWKANLKNVALLEKNFQVPQAARRADRGFVAGLVVALLVVLALVGTLLYVLIKGIYLILVA